jgi:hypothetical protein
MKDFECLVGSFKMQLFMVAPKYAYKAFIGMGVEDGLGFLGGELTREDAEKIVAWLQQALDLKGAAGERLL